MSRAESDTNFHDLMIFWELRLQELSNYINDAPL